MVAAGQPAISTGGAFMARYKIKSGPGKFSLLCLGLGNSDDMMFKLVTPTNKAGELVRVLIFTLSMRDEYGKPCYGSGSAWHFTGRMSWWKDGHKGLWDMIEVEGVCCTSGRYHNGSKGYLETTETK